MTQEQIDAHCTTLYHQRRKIMATKRPEYTEANADVLHNFKDVAAELDIDPLKVWWVYLRKHLASIMRYANNPNASMAEPIDSRFADAMNYLELGYALIQDAQQNSSSRSDFETGQ